MKLLTIANYNASLSLSPLWKNIFGLVWVHVDHINLLLPAGLWAPNIIFFFYIDY